VQPYQAPYALVSFKSGVEIVFGNGDDDDTGDNQNCIC